MFCCSSLVIQGIRQIGFLPAAADTTDGFARCAASFKLEHAPPKFRASKPCREYRESKASKLSRPFGWDASAWTAKAGRAQHYLVARRRLRQAGKFQSHAHVHVGAHAAFISILYARWFCMQAGIQRSRCNTTESVGCLTSSVESTR